MALSINTNIPSLRVDREIQRKSNDLRKNFESLSSGKRINRAADDAAGLAIAESLLADSKINDVASRNINDAISLSNIAEGALSSASSIVTRLGELASQASNGALSDNQRYALNQEFQALRQELDRVAQTTEFNGQQLLSGNGNITYQVGGTSGPESQISVSLPSVSASGLGLASNIVNQDNAQAALDEAKAAISQLAQTQGQIGANNSRLQTAFENLQASNINIKAAESQIRDADIARTTAELTKNNIQQQASVAVKAQANISQQLALRLLG